MDSVIRQLWEAIGGLRARRKGANAGELRGRYVSAAAPMSNDLLGWNATTKKWEPKNSAPAARVYNSGNISINHNTNTELTFDSERYDTDTIHSTGSNTSRLTATTAGKYAIKANIRWAADNDGRRYLSILLNGATVIATTSVPAVQSATTHQSVSTDYDLAATEYVEVRVFHTAGAALNVDAASNFSPEFMMVRMGPRGGAAGGVGDDHGTLTGLPDDDHPQYLLATGARAGSTGAAQDFGSTGIKADVIAESTGAAGVTIDGLLIKDSGIPEAAVTAHEAAIEGAIDTLANLTSIQSLTVTLADAGADALFGWDDTASAYENLSKAEALAVLNVADGADVTGSNAPQNHAGGHTDGTDDIQTATTGQKGIVSELATAAEAAAGTDSSRVVTPSLLPVLIQDSKYVYAADAEASDTYAITLTPAIGAYASGQVFHFKANTANTGAATLNVDGKGAKAILKNHDTALADNDIEAGQIVTVVYDGTQFQMQSQVANAAAGGGYDTIEDEGAAEAQRTTMDIIGGIVDCADVDTETKIYVGCQPDRTSLFTTSDANAHVTIGGSSKGVQVNDYLGIQGTPATAPGSGILRITPTITDITTQCINAGAVLDGNVGANKINIGVTGTADMRHTGSSPDCYGLKFISAVFGAGASALVYGMSIQQGYLIQANSVTAGYGVIVQEPLDVSNSCTVSDMIGIRIHDQKLSGSATITRQYGLFIDDQSYGTSKYLIHAGANPGSPASTIFRIDAGNPPDSASATIGDSNMYLMWTENGSQNHRQVRWVDSGALGGGGIPANTKVLYAV